MSLTGHLRDKRSPIRQFLRIRFPDIRSFLATDRKRIREADTIRPREAVPWSTIGTALDYRIRYYFGLTPPDQLNAYRGARTLSVIHHAREGDLENVGYDALRADFDAFFGSLEGLTKLIQPVGQKLTESDEGQLNRHCVVLALLEEVYRHGVRSQSPLDSMESSNAEALLSIAEEEWIDDLRALSWTFYDGFSHLLPLDHELNPEFDGSRDVEGADGDLIVDGTLIDIKTTVEQRIRPEWIWQSLGYVLLDYSDSYRINAIGLYMARQGILFKWDLRDAIRCLYAGDPPSIEELRSQFKELARSSRQERARMRRMRTHATPSDASGEGC